MYSTIVDTNSNDSINAVAVDAQGEAIITGVCVADFGTPLIARSRSVAADAIIAKLSSDGTSFVYQRSLGGSGSNYGLVIATDADGSVYVAGQTSAPDVATPGAAQSTLAGPVNGFVAKIDSSGSQVLYCSYIGGSVIDSCNAIAVDSLGNAYLAGAAESTNIPLVNPIQTSFEGNCVASSADGGLNWTSAGVTLTNPSVTYIAVDPKNPAVALVGTTGSNLYKTTDGGVTWVTYSAGDLPVGAFAINPANPSIAVAISGQGTIRTTDGGQTWQYTSFGGFVGVYVIQSRSLGQWCLLSGHD